MNKKKKKYILPAIIIILAAALVVLPFIIENSRSSSSGASILSGTVERETISSNISGTGTLTAGDPVEVTVPSGVEITGYLVSDGETVSQGEALACVDKVSVMNAIIDVKETLEYLEEEISDIIENKTSSAIYSSTAGTVETVYAKAGDSVREVMLEHGCLAVIKLSNGDEIKVTGVSGKIAYSYISEGTYVYDGSQLYYISETEYTGEYYELAKQHQEYEDIYAQLFQMYRDGYVIAPSSGYITDIDDSLVEGEGYIVAHQTALETGGEEPNGENPGSEEPSSDPAQPVMKAYGTITAISDEIVTIDFSDETGVEFARSLFASDISVGDICTFSYVLSGEGSKTYTLLYPKASSDAPSGGGGGGMGGGSVGGMSSAAAEAVELFSTEGTLLMNITPTDKMQVTITVDELDILSVKKNGEALVTIDALPGRSFTGTVTEINTTFSNNGGNSKYSAVITLDRSEDMISGMNASCLITVSEVENVLTVPAAALNCENGSSFVYTGYDEKNEALTNPVTVETGIADSENVEIISGLSEGQTFYYAYYDTLEIQGWNPMPDRR